MVVACMVLPSLLINMAVPVNFFHLDRAMGPLTGAGGAGPAASPFKGGAAEATPPLLAVTATVGTTVGRTEVAKMVVVIVLSQKSVS